MHFCSFWEERNLWTTSTICKVILISVRYCKHPNSYNNTIKPIESWTWPSSYSLISRLVYNIILNICKFERQDITFGGITSSALTLSNIKHLNFIKFLSSIGTFFVLVNARFRYPNSLIYKFPKVAPPFFHYTINPKLLWQAWIGRIQLETTSYHHFSKSKFWDYRNRVIPRVLHWY